MRLYLDIESETPVFIWFHFDQNEVVMWNCTILHREENKTSGMHNDVHKARLLVGYCLINVS